MSDAIPDSLSNLSPHLDLDSELKASLNSSASASSCRYADASTAVSYPLPCNTEPLAFLPDPAAGQPNRWRLDIPLPPIAAGSVVIPSYTQLGTDNYRTQFALFGDAGTALLPCVPSATEVPRTSTAVANSQLEGISTHIDYWLIANATEHLTLRLWLIDTPPNARYLLNLSSRPQQLSGALTLHEFDSDQLLGKPQPIRALSQRLGPNAIRGGICSPTATAMAMAQLSPNAEHSWPNFVSACRDGATGLYGVWPLNLYQASRLGYLGAVETLTQGAQLRQVLEAQLPLVTSIKYAKGSLKGAPQPQTSGHLVLLHGISKGKALVSDPAAPVLSEVRREYPLEQFLEAWLRFRGACYLLLPKA